MSPARGVLLGAGGRDGGSSAAVGVGVWEESGRERGVSATPPGRSTRRVGASSARIGQGATECAERVSRQVPRAARGRAHPDRYTGGIAGLSRLPPRHGGEPTGSMTAMTTGSALFPVNSAMSGICRGVIRGRPAAPVRRIRSEFFPRTRPEFGSSAGRSGRIRFGRIGSGQVRFGPARSLRRRASGRSGSRRTRVRAGPARDRAGPARDRAGRTAPGNPLVTRAPAGTEWAGAEPIARRGPR